MTNGIRTIVYPAKDLAKTKALFSALLGVKPTVDEAWYVGFDVDGQHVGLDPRGHADGPVAYCHVDDIRKSLKALLAAGATTAQDVTDVGGGRLIATVKDADDNVIGLLQPG
jgi:predicted enzyme related to lactoylglutathione lyase